MHTMIFFIYKRKERWNIRLNVTWESKYLPLIWVAVWGADGAQLDIGLITKTFNQSHKHCVLQREKPDGRNGVKVTNNQLIITNNICSWGLSALKIGFIWAMWQTSTRLKHCSCCFTMKLKYITMKQFHKYMHKEKY